MEVIIAINETFRHLYPSKSSFEACVREKVKNTIVKISKGHANLLTYKEVQINSDRGCRHF
jgi:hypothetical protein